MRFIQECSEPFLQATLSQDLGTNLSKDNSCRTACLGYQVTQSGAELDPETSNAPMIFFV